MEGDFIFRCHHCAASWNTIELAKTVLRVEWEMASAQLAEAGVTSRIHTAEEIRHLTYRAAANNIFEEGHKRWLFNVRREMLSSWFGDWADLSSNEIYGLFPKAASDFTLERHLVRRQVNIFGRVSGYVLTKSYRPASYLSLEPREPIELSTSPWAAACDWKQIILCATMHSATRIERAVWRWPQERRLPVVLLERFDSWPICYRGVFEKVWMVVRENESVINGVILWNEHETDVRVRRIPGHVGEELPNPDALTRDVITDSDLPSVIEYAADEIVGGDEGTTAHRLSRLVEPSCVPREAKQALLSECSRLSGVPIPKLIEISDVGANPYAVRSRGRLFVCRNGRYLMKDARGRWSEISNFALRIVSTETDAKGNATHSVLVSVDGKAATFTVTAALLENHARLWKTVRRCAARAALPPLIMPNGQHRALIPTLVKSMATAP